MVVMGRHCKYFVFEQTFFLNCRFQIPEYVNLQKSIKINSHFVLMFFFTFSWVDAIDIDILLLLQLFYCTITLSETNRTRCTAFLFKKKLVYQLDNVRAQVRWIQSKYPHKHGTKALKSNFLGQDQQSIHFTCLKHANKSFTQN